VKEIFDLRKRSRDNTCSVADPDPGSGAFLPQGSGSGIREDFFSGSRILTTSQIQFFTFKNGEKQEKLNFVSNMTSILTFSCMKKNFSLLLFVGPGSGIRIRDKRRSDPDQGSGIPKNGRIGIRDKHTGSATLDSCKEKSNKCVSIAGTGTGIYQHICIF
jgi:hypothetical protein